MIKAQASAQDPLTTSVFAKEQPTERMYFPVAHLLGQVTAARRALAKRSRHHRSLPQRLTTRDVPHGCAARASRLPAVGVSALTPPRRRDDSRSCGNSNAPARLQ